MDLWTKWLDLKMHFLWQKARIMFGKVTFWKLSNPNPSVNQRAEISSWCLSSNQSLTPTTQHFGFITGNYYSSWVTTLYNQMKMNANHSSNGKALCPYIVAILLGHYPEEDTSEQRRWNVSCNHHLPKLQAIRAISFSQTLDKNHLTTA